MDIDALKEDHEKHADGEWIGDIPGLGDVRLRVRPMTHPRVVRASGRSYRIASAGKPMTEEAEEKLDREIIAKYVLTGWEGLTQKGKPLKFSPEKALELMGLDKFDMGVRVAMSRAGIEQEAAEDALEKN